MFYVTSTLRFARRVSIIGSENAFKITPQIRAIEQHGERVIKCNIGEPGFPLPAHIADEVKRHSGLDQTHHASPMVAVS